MAKEHDDAEMEAVSTERFIEEVRQQPAIWDYSSSEYDSRMEKVKAWEKISLNVIPNFSNLESKERYKKVVKLQKRWKGLRSCFNREKNRKKIQKKEAAATGRKEYQYFNQLSFLASMSNNGPKTNLPENVLPKSPIVETKPQVNGETHETNILKMISDNIEKQDAVNDHDLNFLKSLLPHLKKVSDEFKLDLQLEILDTLKKYVNYSRLNNNRNQSQQLGYLPNTPATSALPQNIATSVDEDNNYVSQDPDVKEIVLLPFYKSNT